MQGEDGGDENHGEGCDRIGPRAAPMQVVERSLRRCRCWQHEVRYQGCGGEDGDKESCALSGAPTVA
jgi:hypothetical protein